MKRECKKERSMYLRVIVGMSRTYVVCWARDKKIHGSVGIHLKLQKYSQNHVEMHCLAH